MKQSHYFGSPSPSFWERGLGGEGLPGTLSGSPSPSFWESRVPAQRVAGGEGLSVVSPTKPV